MTRYDLEPEVIATPSRRRRRLQVGIESALLCMVLIGLAALALRERFLRHGLEAELSAAITKQAELECQNGVYRALAEQLQRPRELLPTTRP